jgi:hypothetical protein
MVASRNILVVPSCRGPRASIARGTRSEFDLYRHWELGGGVEHRSCLGIELRVREVREGHCIECSIRIQSESNTITCRLGLDVGPRILDLDLSTRISAPPVKPYVGACTTPSSTPLSQLDDFSHVTPSTGEQCFATRLL